MSTHSVTVIETVGSLLLAVPDEAIIDALNRLYEEDQADAYLGVLMVLRDLSPVATTINCELKLVQQIDPAETFVSVCGKELGDETSWAIEFRPWSEWLSMGVLLTAGLHEAPKAEIIAHILNEITWGGWTPEMAEEKLDEIMAASAEVEAMIESGDMSELVAVDLPKAN